MIRIEFSEIKNVKFIDEDIEKLKLMSTDEEIDYMKKLKEE